MLRPIHLTLVAAALTCCASIGSATSTSTPDLDAFVVPAFDYSSLSTTSTSQQLLLQALQQDGIIALQNVPQYAALRALYLQEATQCALLGGAAGDDFVQHKTLQDGTKRFTISATASATASASDATTQHRCPSYVASYHAFSSLIESAVATLGKSLDATSFQITSHEKDQFTATSLLTESVHLDHFHAYEATVTTASADDELLSLELHTDNGMLIAMTAPKYFAVAGSNDQIQAQDSASTGYESGLLIENRAGKLVRPVIQQDELVVMVGSGFQEWIRSSPPLRPVPHAMKYPRSAVTSSMDKNDGSERLVRAWFGKMMLLSPEARMLNVDMTFGDFAAHTQRMLQGQSTTSDEPAFAALACPRGRRLHENDKACVVKQCTPKKGKDPELACSIQCNMSPTSRPGADRLCEENCDCVDKPTASNTTATYCWMLCVDQLPADQCASSGGQRCKTGKEAPYIVDQAFTCNTNTTTTSTSDAVTNAPANSVPSPTTSAAAAVSAMTTTLLTTCVAVAVAALASWQ